MDEATPTNPSDTAGQVERRLGRRHRVFLAGKALVGGVVVDVTFRDMSARGARLLVDQPMPHAGELPVLVLREGLILRSRIIWAKPPMFGLQIREAIDVRGDVPAQFAALADEWHAWEAAKAS